MGFFRRKKDSTEKQNTNKSSKWRHLQDKLAPKTRHLDGVANVETQKILPSGRRPDFYGETWTGERVVGDSKNVEKLTKDHVDQVNEYIVESRAVRGFIVVRKTTEISQDVVEYAERRNISISRMNVTSNAKKLGTLDGFDFFGIGGSSHEEMVTERKDNFGFLQSSNKKSDDYGFNVDNVFRSETLKRKPKRNDSFSLGNLFGPSSIKKRQDDNYGLGDMFGSGNSKPSTRRKRNDDYGFNVDNVFSSGNSKPSTRRKRNDNYGFGSGLGDMFGSGNSGSSRKRRKSSDEWGFGF